MSLVNKRNFKAYKDLHLFGAHALKEFLYAVQNPQVGDRFLGDIYDLSGCKKKHIQRCANAIEELKLRTEYYVIGNHELQFDNQYKIEGNIVWTHTDLLKDPAKYTKFRRKKPGRSSFIRLFIKPIDWLRRLKRDKLEEKFLERCFAVLELHDARFMFGGHLHPTKVIWAQRDGRAVFIGPRGMSTITIEEFKNGEADVIYDGQCYQVNKMKNTKTD